MKKTGPVPVKEINLSDLEGEWVGRYRGHFDQVIRFTVIDTVLVATKVTGDEHVPGGEVTFKADLHRNGIGLGQVAEKEFRNATWVPGRLIVVDKEHVTFYWDGCGVVEFRKDD